MGRMIDADALKLSLMTVRSDELVRYCYPCEKVLKKIDDAPTIEERKTGEWVGIQAYCDHMNKITVGSRFIPSGMVCGVYCNQCWERNSEKKNFCPNCGAKMEGEEHDKG